jgi:hypothetical protein
MYKHNFTNIILSVPGICEELQVEKTPTPPDILSEEHMSPGALRFTI